jgi:phosphoglycerol transferase MdoB-like AlkP superfamily enzyme
VIHFYREADDLDRPGFRLAAERIRELGRGGTPFMATLISISNHYPFISPEPELNVNAGATPEEAIQNSMRYTDDVLREFIESLRGEPWFDRTVFVIVGDHGYNLAEHTTLVGERNGHREAVWVPLVVYGGHPQLSPGAHADTASLLDIAPTITDLLGIREANAWMGHSLVRGVEPTRTVSMERSDAAFAEDSTRRYVREEHTGELQLFDALADPLEQRNLAAGERAHAAALAAQAHDIQVLVDGLLETDRIVPPHRRIAGAGGEVDR